MKIEISDQKYSEEEYLVLEEKAQIMHELISGNLYEMPGGTIYHEDVISNFNHLSKHLLGGWF